MPILTWEEINNHKDTLYFHFSSELLEQLRSDDRYKCVVNKASPLTIAIYSDKSYALYKHYPNFFVKSTYYRAYIFASQCKECGGSFKNTTALGQIITYCPECKK